MNVECILTNGNLGYGKANNIGLKKAKTKYCLVLNPDTIIEKNAIKNFFSRAKTIKDFSIIAPLQLKNEFLKKIFLIIALPCKKQNMLRGLQCF